MPSVLLRSRLEPRPYRAGGQARAREVASTCLVWLGLCPVCPHSADREVAFVPFWLGALKLSRAVPPAGGMLPPWPSAQPFLSAAPSGPPCSFVSWLFPSCFLAHSADGAAAHGTLRNQRAPVLSALLCAHGGCCGAGNPRAWPREPAEQVVPCLFELLAL